MKTIIENNGIRLETEVANNIVICKVLSQTKEATQRIQSVADIKDPKSGIKVRSNRFPSFNAEEKRFYLRGLETKKDNKVIEASFASNKDALEAVNGLKRIVDFLTPENFPINKQSHGKVVYGGTSHCRFYFINRDMAKILCLTGHNHYPIDTVDWIKSKPVTINNANYDKHIYGVVTTLNNSLTGEKEAKFAVNKVKDLFQTAFKQGPNELVACWRTITGLRDCDVKIRDDVYRSNGGTLKVRNAFITNEMANILDVKFANEYFNNAMWRTSPPIITGNKHYDEHIGQIVDVLNKNSSAKDYSENVVNQHRVGSKSSKFVVKMIKEAINEAFEKGDSYLISLWCVMTGLRGPDCTD